MESKKEGLEIKVREMSEQMDKHEENLRQLLFNESKVKETV